MRRVEEQPEKFWISGRHQPIDIGLGLHAGASMVVVDDPQPVIVGDAPDLVQAGDEPVPLPAVEFGLIGEGGDRLQMHRISDFRGIDIVDAERLIERDCLPERLQCLLAPAVHSEEARQPRPRDVQTAQFESSHKNIRVLRVFAPHLGALPSRSCPRWPALSFDTDQLRDRGAGGAPSGEKGQPAISDIAADRKAPCPQTGQGLVVFGGFKISQF
jgi:hypothetical protein